MDFRWFRLEWSGMTQSAYINMPDDTQPLYLLAAANKTGDPLVVPYAPLRHVVGYAYTDTAGQRWVECGDHKDDDDAAAFPIAGEPWQVVAYATLLMAAPHAFDKVRTRLRAEV